MVHWRKIKKSFAANLFYLLFLSAFLFFKSKTAANRRNYSRLRGDGQRREDKVSKSEGKHEKI